MRKWSFIILALMLLLCLTACSEESPQATVPGESCTHMAGDWIVDIAATCSTEGRRHKECTICNATLETERIAKTGHTVGDWTVVKEASCSEEGMMERKCTTCKKVIGTSVVDMIDHIPGDWVVTEEATCTENGKRVCKCTVCKTVVREEIIARPGHTAGDWALVKESTCTEEGCQEKKCTVCGEFVLSEAIAPKGHTPGSEWIVAEEATCSTEGRKEQKCTVCGGVANVEFVPKTGHTAGDWFVTKAPSLSAEGVKEQKCAVCSAVVATVGMPKIEGEILLEDDFNGTDLSGWAFDTGVVKLATVVGDKTLNSQALWTQKTAAAGSALPKHTFAATSEDIVVEFDFRVNKADADGHVIVNCGNKATIDFRLTTTRLLWTKTGANGANEVTALAEAAVPNQTYVHVMVVTRLVDGEYDVYLDDVLVGTKQFRNTPSSFDSIVLGSVNGLICYDNVLIYENPQ